MDVRIEQRAGGWAALLSGRFTFADSNVFGRILDQQRSGGSGRVILDLAGLDFIDSAGMGMLLMLRDEARKSGAEVVLKAPKGQVRKLLGVVKFDSLFHVEE